MVKLYLMLMFTEYVITNSAIIFNEWLLTKYYCLTTVILFGRYGSLSVFPDNLFWKKIQGISNIDLTSMWTIF